MAIFTCLELEFANALKALFEVWLHAVRILGLGQNRQQVIVRQKVKAREKGALGLEVLMRGKNVWAGRVWKGNGWVKRIENKMLG